MLPHYRNSITVPKVTGRNDSGKSDDSDNEGATSDSNAGSTSKGMNVCFLVLFFAIKMIQIQQE